MLRLGLLLGIEFAPALTRACGERSARTQGHPACLSTLFEDASEPLLPDRATGALGRWNGAEFGTWSFAGRCFVRHLAIVREPTEVGRRIPSRRCAVLLVKQPTPSHRPFEIAPAQRDARRQIHVRRDAFLIRRLG